VKVWYLRAPSGTIWWSTVEMGDEAGAMHAVDIPADVWTDYEATDRESIIDRYIEGALS
jgi:hypothetical protein